MLHHTDQSNSSMTDHRTVGRRDIFFIACCVRWTLRCRNRSRPSCAHIRVYVAGSGGARVRALAGPPGWRRIPTCESVYSFYLADTLTMSGVNWRRYLWWCMNSPTTSWLCHTRDPTMIRQISDSPASLLFLLLEESCIIGFHAVS